MEVVIPLLPNECDVHPGGDQLAQWQALGKFVGWLLGACV